MVLMFSLLAGFMRPVAVSAETLPLSSPEQGWSLRFDAPPLDYQEISSSEIRYRFFGRTRDGFFLSLHVEPFFPQDPKSLSCRQQYIRDASSLPSIVMSESLVIVDQDVQSVYYNALIQYKQQQYQMPNRHYFFELNGYCADLHIGASPTYDKFEKHRFVKVADLLKESLSVDVRQVSRVP